MAEALDHVFDIDGDQRFVLDDHDIGCDLPRDFLRGAVEKGADLIGGHVENLGGLLGTETLDRDQQEGLAGKGRNGCKIDRCTLFPGKRRDRFRHKHGRGTEK
ncbi:hypothetical protein D9M70_578590 [compost metagenome]